MTISLQQPMRPAEIELVTQGNQNTTDISEQTSKLASEIATRANADTSLSNRITSEVNARESADTALGNRITKETNARENADTQLSGSIANETNSRVNGDASLRSQIQQVSAKFPVTTSNITDKAVTSSKLEESIQQQLSFLQTVPAIEFGTSNSVDVGANSNATVDITFGSVKTEAPVVLCGLQHESGNLTCIVTGVTNQQCSVTVYNLASTDVTGVTVDYIAISGR